MVWSSSVRKTALQSVTKSLKVIITQEPWQQWPASYLAASYTSLPICRALEPFAGSGHTCKMNKTATFHHKIKCIRENRF